MFLSQDTLMGRVASVCSLLKRSFVKKNKVAWVKRVTKNLHGPSNYSWTLLGVLCQLTDQGVLSLEKLMGHVCSVPAIPSDFKHFLFGLDKVGRYSGLLGLSLSGKEITHTEDDVEGFLSQ